MIKCNYFCHVFLSTTPMVDCLQNFVGNYIITRGYYTLSHFHNMHGSRRPNDIETGMRRRLIYVCVLFYNEQHICIFVWRFQLPSISHTSLSYGHAEFSSHCYACVRSTNVYEFYLIFFCEQAREKNY